MKSFFNPQINTKIILLSSLVGLLIIGILVFIIYPFYTRIGVLNTELYDQRVQLAIYQQQRLNLDETRDEYNKIKSDIDTIASVLLIRDDLPDFIDSLDSLAQNYNVKQNINLSNIDKIVDSENLIININLIGQWQDLNSYLFNLENLDYYLLIDNMKLVNNIDSSIMEFNMAVYLQ